MNDDQNHDTIAPQEAPQSSDEPTVESPIPPPDSKPADLPPVAPEVPRDAPSPVPVESQNGGVNESESAVVEVPKEPQISESILVTSAQPAPAPQTSNTSQPQSLAQQDQKGFIRVLLAKAQAKIQFNKQKKLEKLMEFAQKKKIITNSDVQKLLRVSDRTATRYLVKLVQQGRLLRVGDPRDAKYQFVR